MFQRTKHKLDVILFTDDFEIFLKDPLKYKDKLINWKARQRFLKNHLKLKNLTKQNEPWAIQSETSDNPLSSSEDDQKDPIPPPPKLREVKSVRTPLITKRKGAKLL